MARESAIAWCDGTANFWWGCQKVSPGCTHCYADTLASRYGKQIWGHPSRTNRERKFGIWRDIVRWDREAKREGIRKRIFVQSMSDFLEDHPVLVEWRKEAVGLIEALEWLDILMLTKRPENAAKFLPDWYRNWPSHVWFGTSVENQEYANVRLSYLLDVPAKIRFLSCEPLLDAVNLDLAGAHWVIVGGESGHGARPFNVDWARSLRDQCKSSDTAFFMKQLGSNPIGIAAKGKGENLDDLPVDLRIRGFPDESR